MWLDLGGTQGVQGQIMGQGVKPTRRGVARNQGGGLGPTGLIRKPPPSGGGGTVVQLMQQGCSLQVCLGQSGAQQKNAKNVTKVGT